MSRSVRRVRADEWRRIRDIRLRALVDAPLAFETTHDEAADRPDSSWIDRARLAAAATDQATFVGEAEGSWIATASAYTRPGEPDRRQLVAMWVDPDHRRTGFGSSLVASVVEWARESGAGSVGLWVVENNHPAIALYRHSGFSPTGARQGFGPAPELEEIEMVRPTGRGQSRRSRTV